MGLGLGPAGSHARARLCGHGRQKDYLAGHKGLVVALDRATGRAVVALRGRAAAQGSYGFPGSPAVGAGWSS